MLSVPKGADYCKNSVIRYKKPLTDQAVGGFAAGRSPLSVPKGADFSLYPKGTMVMPDSMGDVPRCSAGYALVLHLQ